MLRSRESYRNVARQRGGVQPDPTSADQMSQGERDWRHGIVLISLIIGVPMMIVAIVGLFRG